MDADGRAFRAVVRAGVVDLRGPEFEAVACPVAEVVKGVPESGVVVASAAVGAAVHRGAF